MNYRGYSLSPVTRHLAGGSVEGVEISGEGRRTWASTEAVARRAVDTWEKAKRVERAGGQAKTIAKGGR